MGKLSDILGARSRDIQDAWDATAEAEDFAPLPPGEYACRIVAGELETSRSNNTPGYKLTFRVLEGDHANRLIWHDVWLTPAALPMAKRDLRKLGIVDLAQLEQPLPPGMRASVKLALRRGDDGAEYNRVRRLDVIGIDEPEPDAFAPEDAAQSEEKTESEGGAA